MSKEIIGINIGSSNTVIGTYKNGVFEVVLSDTSSRVIPTVVSYNERERTIGEISRKNYKNIIIYPNRWLGIQKDFPFFDKESKYSIYSPINKNDNNKNVLSFKINYKKKLDFYTPECIMALFFSKIKSIWQKKDIKTNNVVVSIPDYCTVQERKAMLESIQISGLNCTALINESSAITLAYGFQKLKDLLKDNNPRIVVFIDLGHSKTSIIYAEFNKTLLKILSVTSERFCGARDFDYLIAEEISYEFLKKYGLEPNDSPKAKISFFEKINKSRKALTGNKEVSLQIDSLMDNKDIEYHLKRENFEKIIEKALNKFKNICKNSLEKAKIKGVNLDNIHSIEMVGDTIRTPIINDIIKKIFNREISKTLVPDEFIERCCSIFAMMNSPFYTIKNFSIKHYNPYLIQIKNPSNEQQNLDIFLEGEDIPLTKKIIFHKFQLPFKNIIIKLFYDEKNPDLVFLKIKLLYIFII